MRKIISPITPDLSNLPFNLRSNMASKLGIYEFNIMPINEQANYLWENGTFLANRVKGSMKIQLLVLDRFQHQQP
jgi:hypothetical protein